MLQPWWERWAGRLECELGALDAVGIRYRLDEAACAAGYIRLAVWPLIDGKPQHLIATYPDLYPFFRFEVTAPALELPHHQHPFGKNLCLMGRSTHNWDSDDTLAAHLRDRLPLVLRAGRTDDPAVARPIEEHQAEPLSDYYPYRVIGANVLVDSAWRIDPAIPWGRLVIGVEGTATRVLCGAVLQVQDAGGQVLAEADPALARRYPRVLHGRWVRSQMPIKEADTDRFLATLAEQHARLARPDWRQLDDVRLDVVGVIFPEESSWRRDGDGWIFVVRAEELTRHRPDQRARAPQPGMRSTYFARAGRAGRGDLAARVPELAPLASRRVALFGLGALGAPVALDLARAGIGELRVLDPDIIEAGTTVRWPLGVALAGWPKAIALEQFIGEHYPYTRVRPYVHRLGGAPDDESPDRLVIDEVLDSADIVIDATAEWGVHHALSHLARERGIPYVYAFATRGYWGGLVARVRPNVTEGCWGCLEHRRQDGSLPWPPEDPSGPVQPVGCADPTFTGAGFDVAEVAVGVVRLAVATLTGDTHGAYPDVDWDVATVALRDTEGRVTAPCWSTFPLNRHPDCEACAAQ